ncbi:hypothetical protein LWF15_19940 [Kineosporia rhizophila]|uniref:DUF6879 family protein n=1 Tax=Kineosporia rhizophila TaxID=84633 RepID=UPI001E2FB1B7|nr:DUF6879 family protein [Kineosporia rhizophila]MCE0537768.1 hypothetical protein [Kineosporia rhizophila]
MLDLSKITAGERLLGDAYWSDFDDHFWRIGTEGFWKLERLQHFQEPGDDSWVAFSRGNWQEAMALLDQRREALTQHYSKMRAHGFETWRIRVVQEPLSDYMRWELQLLRLRHELGGHTRVIDAGDLAEYETGQVLPELVTLGDDVMYELLYNDDGLQEGGIRYSQPDQVASARDLIQELYSMGEDIAQYAARHPALAARRQP